ncbi:NADH-quinone oxidoreductase subunit F [Acetobacter tropicalis]|uniref:NADH-ubiquinone oxidoreductase chain F n=1 Tax=Acetobacter tropicalis TaxID=104102 RepID=A0A094YI76_9PROT|nr:NADH-ubiquinone oxidoreductase-F iron-sulfur binding region domain-containing protein [Acetobacter tropicalis]KAA8383567.1 NADH-quinone oxidoreductase subunit F [Acetobacter tropicalis]KAA8389350.1 NADH-quinone oxidoreductase subunit F [Acetobacter tropicalis]KGB21042.1 NADH-ubiquinone oxidoreductase chain F [Acetobacter tropicalis]MBC9008687.1 SLBB domain-containing protein [Acetobacter tropicalis]MDO8173028.1 NADH-ubiquinone oxidoreductase-F iron-sulfur binding region domain-containing pr
MSATPTPLTAMITPSAPPPDCATYERAGGWQATRKALKTLAPADVIDIVTRSKLRGRGGAGFGTGQKWSFVPKELASERRKYLIANADEMEPGTFKDRWLLEGNPLQLVEGMILAAYAIQAGHGIIFLRGEYHLPRKRLTQAISEAREKGWLGDNILGSGFSFDIHLHSSGGRYICGEETALLTALEGRRATPRSKPPFPQFSGLWGASSVVNNVETLSNLPHIIANGPEWFISLGTGPDSGTKLYGVSGRVRKPGAWELPIGTPLRQIIEDYAGGMLPSYKLRALLPGGASTAFLDEAALDVAMDYGSVEKAGSRLGTGMAIVLDDRTCPVGMILNLEHFFAQESCGWCTPCRDGLPWVERLLSAIEEGSGETEDIEQLARHARMLGTPGRTFCAHAPGAMAPLASGLKLFADDFSAHISHHGCPLLHAA